MVYHGQSSSRLSLDVLILPLVTLMSSLISSSALAEIDNGIIGEPEVQCGADTVELQFRSQHPFRGKVYVKGHYSSPDCRVDYSSETQNSTGGPTGGIVIKHGRCDMERQRILNPQGMQFSAVVVISFHPTFITKIDKAFNVKCNYRELVRTVTSSIEVSMLTTQVLSYSFPMPTCNYTIRRDELDGEVLQYARVGEQVVHRWECQSDIFGILVHSCMVEDGQGEKFEVIDSRGCHVDDYVLSDPTYVEALNLAYREAHVVKFADRITVRFQCQLKLCMKADGGCRGITPPICPGGTRSQLRVNSTASNSSTSSRQNVSFFNSGERVSQRRNDSELTSSTSSPSPTTSGRSTRSNSDETSTRSTTLSRRLRRRELGQPPHNVIDFNSLPNLIDADFNSQILYVLDSTENPDKGTKHEKQALDSFFRRGPGAIVSDGRSSNELCMSSITFSLLMASVTVVFVVAAFASALICSRKTTFGEHLKPRSSKHFQTLASTANSSDKSLWK